MVEAEGWEQGNNFRGYVASERRDDGLELRRGIRVDRSGEKGHVVDILERRTDSFWWIALRVCRGGASTNLHDSKFWDLSY